MEDSQKEVMDAIQDLRQVIEKNEIEDMRWTILDFANTIQDGTRCNGEMYVHILEIFDSYEKLLEKNGMENGRVDAAMGLINERYKEGLRMGFPI